MADADAEAAFLSSMQAMNEAGNYEATSGASEQQADSYSSDEYDPAQAADLPPDLSDDNTPLNQTSLVGASQHDTLPFTSMSQQSPVSADSILTTSVAQRSSTATPSARDHSRPLPVDAPNLPNGLSTPNAYPNHGTPSRAIPSHGGEVVRSTANGVLDTNGDPNAPASRSVSPAPFLQLSTEDVSIQNSPLVHNSADMIQNDVPDTVPNPSSVLPDSGPVSQTGSTSVPTNIPQAQLIVLPQSPTSLQNITPSTAAPRARLPHDKIGILEDRIKEDPRGDLDAWLSLIGEHKKRGKIEDARNVYERFFKVFPSAVRLFFLQFLEKAILLTNLFRHNNGLRMPRWRTRRKTEMPWRMCLAEPYLRYQTSSYGQCISTTSAGTIILPRIPQVLPARLFIKRTILQRNR